jgi:hypothetical protein
MNVHGMVVCFGIFRRQYGVILLYECEIVHGGGGGGQTIMNNYKNVVKKKRKILENIER